MNSKNEKSKKSKLFIISMIVIATIFLGVMVFLIINQLNNAKIICDKNGTSINGVKQVNNVVINMKKKKISVIKESKKITLDRIPKDFDALDVIKRALEEEYKNIGITYQVENKKDYLMVNLTYNGNKTYILDNIMVSLENDGIGINVIKEDKESNYLTFDLGKDYSKSSIISTFKNNGYSCK